MTNLTLGTIQLPCWGVTDRALASSLHQMSNHTFQYPKVTPVATASASPAPQQAPEVRAQAPQR